MDRRNYYFNNINNQIRENLNGEKLMTYVEKNNKCFGHNQRSGEEMPDLKMKGRKWRGRLWDRWEDQSQAKPTGMWIWLGWNR